MKLLGCRRQLHCSSIAVECLPGLRLVQLPRFQTCCGCCIHGPETILKGKAFFTLNLFRQILLKAHARNAMDWEECMMPLKNPWCPILRLQFVNVLLQP